MHSAVLSNANRNINELSINKLSLFTQETYFFLFRVLSDLAFRTSFILSCFWT